MVKTRIVLGFFAGSVYSKHGYEVVSLSVWVYE